MKPKVEKLGDDKEKLTVSVPASEVDAKIQGQYKQIAQKYNFPGFRRGHVPRAVINNAYGEQAILAMVTEEVINNTYPIAIDDSGSLVIGQPVFDKEDTSMVQPGKSFDYSFIVNVRPEFELDNYGPVEIEMPSAEVTDSEIDDQIDKLCAYYVKWEDAAATAKVGKTSHIDIKLNATDGDGNTVEELTSDKRMYVMGSKLMPEEFEKELEGKTKGKKFTIALDVDKDNPSPLLSMVAGKKLTLEVEVLGVKKEVRPKITDEWVKETLQFENVADLRKRTSDQIAQSKEAYLPRIKERRCLDVLRGRLKGEASDILCEDTESNMLQDFFGQLQQQGITFDAYLQHQGIDQEQFKKDLKEQAKDSANETLAIEAWARKKNIDCSGEDIKEEFKSLGYTDIKKIKDEWRKNGRMHLVAEAIVRKKAVEDIVESAKVTIEVPKDSKKTQVNKETKESKQTKTASKSKTTSKTKEPASKKATSKTKGSTSKKTTSK